MTRSSYRRLCAAALFALPLAACGGGSPAAAKPRAAPARVALLPLTITGATGKLNFRVEIARTESEQARGLMFRTSLPHNGGMLFPFDPPRPASFWMKNTVIPLDMLFIRPDGVIERIAQNTKPYSLDPVVSGGTVSAVLEIAGGRAASAGIAEGDKVSWPGGPAG